MHFCLASRYDKRSTSKIKLSILIVICSMVVANIEAVTPLEKDKPDEKISAH